MQASAIWESIEGDEDRGSLGNDALQPDLEDFISRRIRHCAALYNRRGGDNAFPTASVVTRAVPRDTGTTDMYWYFQGRWYRSDKTLVDAMLTDKK